VSISPRREKFLTATALLIVTLSGFALIAGWQGSLVVGAAAWPESFFDRAVPLVPGAVWVYLSWYVAPLLMLAVDIRQFRRAAAAILCAFFVCAVGWALWPAVMRRPDLSAARDLSVLALRTLYAFDPPTNLFPSFHAAVAAVLTQIRFRSPVVRAVIRLWMAAICAACVLTKQHEAADVLAGVAVGLGAIWLTDRYGEHYLCTGEIWRPRQSRPRWAGPYPTAPDSGLHRAYRIGG
jgi:hypothetical protein